MRKTASPPYRFVKRAAGSSAYSRLRRSNCPIKSARTRAFSNGISAALDEFRYLLGEAVDDGRPYETEAMVGIAAEQYRHGRRSSRSTACRHRNKSLKKYSTGRPSRAFGAPAAELRISRQEDRCLTAKETRDISRRPSSFP